MIAPDPDILQAVRRRGRSALAWEVLRRDPGYRADYCSLALPLVGDAAADAPFVSHWGLHFR